MRAALLDEPDSSIYPTSKEGIKLRSILGKARQQSLFLGYCATDMKDIPNYIYKKITGIFFTPHLGEGMFFKDRPKHHIFVMQTIKQQYEKMGYKAFFINRASMGCISFRTIKATPFNPEQELSYLKDKMDDYKKDIKSFIGMEKEHTKKKEFDRMEYTITQQIKKGKSCSEVGELFDMTKQNVQDVCRRWGLVWHINKWINEEDLPQHLRKRGKVNVII
jgi:hypothetical protein